MAPAFWKMAVADTWNPQLIARSIGLLVYGQALSDEGRPFWVLRVLSESMILMFVVLAAILWSLTARLRRNPRSSWGCRAATSR